MFLSQARGKVGSVVFSVIRGQQVERVHNPSPANPRTLSQQAQRSLLANMTKFYKRGTQNFFRFAFEDRTARESDFNAFARNNMQQGCYLTRELYENRVVPALGEFMLTKGSIDTSLGLIIHGDQAFLNTIIPTLLATVGDFSTWILSAQPTVQQGDIVTIVVAEADFIPGNIPMGNTPPLWDTIQFKIDTSDNTQLTSLGISMADDSTGTGGYYMYVDINSVDRASFGAIVISRNTEQGLKVSTSSAALGPAAALIVDWNRGEFARRHAAASWGGNPDAFLQGGNLSALPVVTAVKFDTITSNAYSYGLGAIVSTAGSPALRAAAVSGQNLKTTAQGGLWEMTLYDATPFEGEAMDFDPWRLPVRATIALTATGTPSSVDLAGNWDDIYNGVYMVNTQSQFYGLLRYNGIPVWWGALAVVE